MSSRKTPPPKPVETTGHSWDGIEELNNPLPRWWLWTFYLTILWGIGYVAAYPAWPLIAGATPGFLGYSTRAEVSAEIRDFEDRNAALSGALAGVELAALEQDPALQHYAVASGASVFLTYCSQCHGSGAAGAPGYPNLLDDDWLWGGGVDEIAYSIRHGIRNTTDPDARYSQMPAYDEFLEPEEIDALVHHLLSLTEREHDPQKAGQGALSFTENCASCHGEGGLGDREIGAPNLTDAIWLYGGDAESIRQSVSRARFGVMPAWGDKLSAAQINAVAAYVHQLGGGE